jgi:L-ascorbate metabolism protein UlaG (beta-lactamase superfamily)
MVVEGSVSTPEQTGVLKFEIERGHIGSTQVEILLYQNNALKFNTVLIWDSISSGNRNIKTFELSLKDKSEAKTESNPTAQESPYSQIQTILRSHPPCAGNKEIRRDAILALDEALKDDYARIDPHMQAFYKNMMGFVETEINEYVSAGVRIWSMYNHGYIVKTPSTVFAFDIVGGYSQWNYRIPDTILEQIQVLFVSHRHGDHRDESVTDDVVAFGGEVVAPSEDEETLGYGTIYLSPGEELTVAGLEVKAYGGLHGDTPVRIYEVTTPEGLTIMHTGDNQTSDTLPDGVTVDILFLNAWVNDSGAASAIDGMRNSINKLSPSLTIPGHIQELYHDYDLSNPATRVPFEWPLAVDDLLVPGEVSVQIWGERCDFPTE